MRILQLAKDDPKDTVSSRVRYVSLASVNCFVEAGIFFLV